MDFAETLRIAQLIVTIAVAIGTPIVGFWAYGAKQAVKNANLAAAAAQVPTLKELVEKQHAELTDQRHRFREIEQKLAAKPTVDMVHQIQLSLARLEGRIESYSTELKSVGKAADAAIEACNRIEEFFVEKGIKS